jgi:hypothetical protein
MKSLNLKHKLLILITVLMSYCLIIGLVRYNSSQNIFAARGAGDTAELLKKYVSQLKV